MRNSFTPYFISLAVRNFVLRIIILSSLSSFLINVILGEKDFHNFTGIILMCLSIIPLSVSLHHIFRLWPRKKWLVRSELIYSIIEFGFATGYFIAEILIEQSDPEHITICILPAAFFWLSVSASIVFMIWNLHVSQYRTLGHTYDFLESYDDTMISPKKFKTERWSLLFGGSIFRRRFGIDRMFVRGLRAGISILCFFAMLALGFMVLIVQPLQKQYYFQTMRTTDYSDENVTLEVFLDIGTDPGKWFPSELVNLDVTWRPESQKVACLKEDILKQVTCNVSSPFFRPSPDNLIITIDYTRALQQFSVSSLRTGVNLIFGSEVEDAAPFSLPIQLYPGFHLFGTTFYSFRDTYAGSRFLVFGIPQFNRQLILKVQALIPDPEFTNSPSDNATASLRLTYQGGLPNIVQSEYEVQVEQSSNSVVSGFALLGGVWTFINGLFAAIFGCSLLLVLCGIKPLSIYGLVHIFQSRRSLVDGGYTISAEEQTRIIAVLREHLLDEENGGMKVGEAGEERNRDEERMQLHDIA